MGIMGSCACNNREKVAKNIFLSTIILLLNINFSSSLKNIKLGVPIPWSGSSWDAGPRFAAGISVAIDYINNRPDLLPGYNVSFIWGDSKCEEKAALETIVDMYTKETVPVNAIIGPACSDGCKVGALLASHWNIPVVSYGCAASYLSDLEIYPNFARTVGVYSKSGKIFVSLMEQYKWKQIAILTPTSGIWSSIMNGVRADIELTEGLEVSYFQNFNHESVTPEFLRRILQEAVKKAHIFLLGGYRETIRQIMVEAKYLGLTSAGYSFITYELLLDECTKLPSNASQSERDGCDALDGVLDVSLFVPQGEHYDNFSKLVRRKMADPPFNRVMPDDEEVEIYAAFLHDAALLYAHALNQTLNMNGSINDGKLIVQNMLNMTFDGESGKVVIDSVGDRASALQLKNVKNMAYHRVANYFVDSANLEMLNTTINWPGGTNTAPVGRPPCGFENEYCPASSTTEPWVYALAGVLTLVVILVIVVFLVIHYRRKAFEQALMSQQWRVRYSDIHFNRKVMRWASHGGSKALTSAGSQTTLDSNFIGEAHGQVFTRIGLLQGNYVAIKELRKESITLTRDILLELKEVSEMQHQNINIFIGACVDSPHICILTQYCNKGSLQDVLYNEDIKLDWMFQISIASDIARGMHYLQNNTPIVVHGNLKSTNCVIDSRFVCKITDVGLIKFKDGQDQDLEGGDEHYWNSLLWVSPDHIDNPKNPHSKEGDVYSYGIILQEILIRGFPFCMYTDLSAKEIVTRVKKRLQPPFRPKVSDEFGLTEYRTMMKQCWEEDPHNRPKFDEVLKTLKKLNGGKNINIVDNMINMMEKYTDHLEELVAERTKQLEEEKAKTDELLYRMLPKSVAEQLKHGESVRAESFDMVTIFFSDIVGFTKLAAESTPLEEKGTSQDVASKNQVVDLLNDLYTCFDQIVDQHHVYKVETIGDAYMVVSGIPERNGNRHAGEIARMSLDLLSATTTFTVRHKPEAKLQLRIGIHSGPAVAGVVGLKMPRYCLFGDTVNYASRMESSGLALRIHVSPECQTVLAQLGGYHLVERGPVTMKGKGTIVTFFLAGYDGFAKPLPDLREAASLEEHSFK